MQKLVLIALVFFCASVAHGQATSQNARREYSGTAAPTWNCSPGPIWRDIYIRTTTNTRYQCTAAPNVWTPDPAGTGTVTSVSVVTANGLSGTTANPTTTPAITLNIAALDAAKIGGGGVSTAEFDFLGTITSNVQTQIDAKSPIASPTFTGTVTIPTPFTLGAVSVLPTGTELNFVDGVTSAIQTQLDSKQATLTNSAGLRAALSDENGTGAGLFDSATSPTFLTSIAISTADRPTLVLDGTSGTSDGRVLSVVNDWIGVSQNLSFDGTNWNLDNVGLPGWFLRLDARAGQDIFEVNRASAGANPRTPVSLLAVNSVGQISPAGGVLAPTYSTSTNCADSAGAAACGSASAGHVVIDAGSSSVVISTTAVTANSEITPTFDASVGARLGITCNTTIALPAITARTAATSFTITIAVSPITNPACFGYTIRN